MKIQLISHSSVVIETSDARIWADPWIIGRAFNDSWSLYPAPAYDESMLDQIDYIWISHEHPDHFSIPSLRSLPEEFRKRVTVLFQGNNSDKMFEAFTKLGFPNHRRLPHRTVVQLTSETELYCYQVGAIDSSLGVRNQGETIYNVNDSTLSSRDAALMRREFGDARVVLNQFSTAGYPGFEDYKKYLTEMASEHLAMMLQNHRDLGALDTIPFASFMVYCTEDNKHLNEFANRPQTVCDYFDQNDERLALLYLGDSYDTQDPANLEPYDPDPALSRFADDYKRLSEFEFDTVQQVPIDEIETAFRGWAAELRDKYPRALLALLKPVSVFIPDLNTSIRFRIADATWSELPAVVSEDADLVVYSQPLHFTFATPFGVQTLGVSARMRLLNNSRNWAFHRVLSSLHNAGIYLRPKYFLTRRNLRFLAERGRGLATQLRYRLGRMAKGF